MEDIPNSESSETATYENEYYGFSLDYPSSWANRIEISYGSWASDAEATVDFAYVNPSKEIEQYVFSLLIHDEIVDEVTGKTAMVDTLPMTEIKPTPWQFPVSQMKIYLIQKIKRIWNLCKA